MALDQGTTSSRTIIYDKAGNIKSVVQREFTQIFPHEGWVEHDAMEIWASQMGTAQEALLKAGFEILKTEHRGEWTAFLSRRND